MFGDLGGGHSAKDLELEDGRAARVSALEVEDRLRDFAGLVTVRVRESRVDLECDVIEFDPFEAVTALGAPALAGVIGKDVPHYGRAEGEEVPAAAGEGGVIGNESQVDLVDDGGGREGVAESFGAHEVRGHAP